MAYLPTDTSRDESLFEIRPYQAHIAQQALHDNTIAFLPTGMGKTFVAIYVLEQRLRTRSIDNEKKVSIFIAPKKNLVNQHFCTLQRYFCGKDVKIKEINGETISSSQSAKHVDNWDKNDWLSEIESYDVLVMTPKFCLDLLGRKFLPLASLDLLILDECHCATRNHEMARVCDLLLGAGAYKPLLLGLTATPINNTKGNIKTAILDLEARTNCTFFYPTEEFIASLNHYKTEAVPLIVQYSNYSNDSGNSFSFEMFGSDEKVYNHWEKLKWRMDIIEMVDKLVDHDKAFNTTLCAKLFQQVIPENPPTLVLKRSKRMSTWKKLISQCLYMTKTAGILAGCFSLKFYLKSLKSLYSSPSVYSTSIRSSRHYKNDESQLAEQITKIADYCQENDNESLDFLFDQPMSVLSTVMETILCLFSLLSKDSIDSFLFALDDLPIATSQLRSIDRILLNTVIEWIKQRCCFKTKEIDLLQKFTEIFGPGKLYADENGLVEVLILIIDRIVALLEKKSIINDRGTSAANILDDWADKSMITTRVNTTFRIVAALLHVSMELPLPSPAEIFLRDCRIQIVHDNTAFNLKSFTIPQWMDICTEGITSDINHNHQQRTSSGIIIFCELKLMTEALVKLFNIYLRHWCADNVSDNCRPECAFLHGGLPLRVQKDILYKFRTGKLQVLFASEVAEEGIDIAKCRYVIHFDPPKTLRAHIQRRGRARAKNAQFIHIWPSEESSEFSLLRKRFVEFHQDEINTYKFMETLSNISRDSMLFMPQNQTFREIVTEDGKTLDIISAQTLVTKYCHSLRKRHFRSSILNIVDTDDDDEHMVNTDGLVSYTPYFRFQQDYSLGKRQFKATLYLPQEKMLHLSQYGHPVFEKIYSNKRVAQGLASLQAAKWLLSVNEIDHNTLQPIAKRIPLLFRVPDRDGECAGGGIIYFFDGDDEDQDDCDSNTEPTVLSNEQNTSKALNQQSRVANNSYGESSATVWKQKIVPDILCNKSSTLIASETEENERGLFLYKYHIEILKHKTSVSTSTASAVASNTTVEPIEPSYTADDSYYYSKHGPENQLCVLQQFMILTVEECLTIEDIQSIDGFPLTFSRHISSSSSILSPSPILDSSSTKNEVFSVRYQPYGSQWFSYTELWWIQECNRGLLHLETDKFAPEQQFSTTHICTSSPANSVVERNQYGFYEINQVKLTELIKKEESNEDKVIDLSAWSQSGAGACYWICPLLPDYSYQFTNVIQSAVEIQCLICNLGEICRRNQIDEDFLDILNEETSDPSAVIRHDMLYTSTGNSLFCFKKYHSTTDTQKTSSSIMPKRTSPRTVKLSDVMKMKENAEEITYAAHYLKRGNHVKRTEYIHRCLQRKSKEPSFGNFFDDGEDEDVRKIEKVSVAWDAKKTAGTCATAAVGTLYRGYTLSGKLSLVNLLQTPVQSVSNADYSCKKDESVSRKAILSIKKSDENKQETPSSSVVVPYFLPEFSLSVGKLRWYQASLLLPSILVRFQSVLIAKEVQLKLFQPMLRPFSQEQNHNLYVKDDDMVQHNINIPPLDIILQALTSRRCIENISNERLEVLGDSFLKYASSLYIFLQFQDQFPTAISSVTADLFTRARTDYIRNSYLSTCANRLGIVPYLRIFPYSHGLERVHFPFPGSSKGNSINSAMKGYLSLFEEPEKSFLRVRNKNIQEQYHDSVNHDNDPVSKDPQYVEQVLEFGISSKVKADLIEALLGAAVVTPPLTTSTSITTSCYDFSIAWECFRVCVLSPTTNIMNHNISAAATHVSFFGTFQRKMNRFLQSQIWIDPNQPVTFDTLKVAKALQPSLGYQWHYPSFLPLIFTHRSYKATVHNGITTAATTNTSSLPQNYDILEFLGDAILEILVVYELHQRNPTWNEQKLSESKIYLVNNQFLGKWSNSLQLSKYLRHGCMELLPQMSEFHQESGEGGQEEIEVDIVKEEEEEAQFAHDSGTTDLQYSPLSRKYVRKIYADLFEALIGGIYLDSCGDLAAVVDVLRNIGYWKYVETMTWPPPSAAVASAAI